MSFPAFCRTFVILGVLVGLSACGEGNSSEQQATEAPPPQVAVLAVERKNVDLTYTYAGRVAAFREVEIRARVSGILENVAYVEGAKVKAGDVLFRIQPEVYDAEVARTDAQVRQAEAQLAQARREQVRAEQLYAKQFGTQKARDDALSATETAEANLAAAKAQLKTAQINLDYATVTAPIDGITSEKLLSEGSLVGTAADNSLLTRITQLDPVYVNFSYTEGDAAEIRRLLAESGGGDTLSAQIIFGDGQVYDQPGKIDFTDSSLDLQTGTLRARAVFPNPDNRLVPGAFVRATLKGLSLPDAITVPQVAVMQGPQGTFVYTVDSASKAAIRPVTLGREVGDNWLVTEGLEAGDRVVVEGMIKVRPGTEVAVVESKVKAAQVQP